MVFKVKKTDAEKNISQFLSGRIKDFKKTNLEVAFHKKMILANGMPVHSSFIIKAGDEIEARLENFRRSQKFAEAISLDIQYADEHLVVVNKPFGMPCHNGLGIYSGTLLNALLYYARKRGEAENFFLCQRLDRNAHGLMVVARSVKVAKALEQQMVNGEFNRTYHVLVEGALETDEGIINKNIGRNLDNARELKVFEQNEGGKQAITKFKVLERRDDQTMVSCNLITGRTHQIRLHMAFMGHPLVADKRYGSSRLNEQMFLRSSRIRYIHPETRLQQEFTLH